MAANFLANEIKRFRSYPDGMRTLLLANLIYSLILPLTEMFVGTYIIRNSSEIVNVIYYMMGCYFAIPIAFIINGFLLPRAGATKLYAVGMLLSGLAMLGMTYLPKLSMTTLLAAGFVMGLSSGLFWANKGYLTLISTSNSTRNYFYGFETFFNNITGVGVPLLVGLFLGYTEKLGWFGGEIGISYKLLFLFSLVVGAFAAVLLMRHNYPTEPRGRFLYFRFDPLWRRMLSLSILKGFSQGYLVIVPSILIMTLVGNEAELGIIQASGAIFAGILLYFLGARASSSDRIKILLCGSLLYTLGAAIHSISYSWAGVVIFMLCLVLGRPLMDLGYFPIQMQTTEAISSIENRSKYTYIVSHEVGIFIGRIFGFMMFLSIAWYISDKFALRYCVLAVGLLQIVSVPVANSILKRIVRQH